MTGYRSQFMRHDCGIGVAVGNCYFDTLPSWDYLIDCFPRGIRPTDIDGMVEMNGSFLFLEQKGEGVPLQTGQLLAFKRLAELPKVTVVIFRPRGAQDFDVMALPSPAIWEPVTRADFVSRLQRWTRNADDQGRAA